MEAISQEQWDKAVRAVTYAAETDPIGFRARLERNARRERIATAALCGLLAAETRGPDQQTATLAVGLADALIAELDK